MIFTVKPLNLYNNSRMMGDYHVQFCERLGVNGEALMLRNGINSPCLLDHSTLAFIGNRNEIDKVKIKR
jgi:hypothetical protein